MIAIDLSDRTVLITGATSELGRVMTRTFARAGANVGIHYFHNRTKAAELTAEVEQLGRRAVTVQADITREADVCAMRDTVADTLGAPDIIVNNAVIQFDWTSVLEQDLAAYEGQFRSSVLHNVLMAKAFVPAMRTRKWGRVIGINTECTMQCSPSQSAYISGKAGMDRVLRVLAKEIGGDNITVNQVAPGWTISENRPSEIAPPSYAEAVPLRRRGFDREIANVVVFLASELASFISGAYIPVCGGNVMPRI